MKAESLEKLQEYQEKLLNKKSEILKELHGFNLLKNASIQIVEKELDLVSQSIFKLLHEEI